MCFSFFYASHSLYVHTGVVRHVNNYAASVLFIEWILNRCLNPSGSIVLLKGYAYLLFCKVQVPQGLYPIGGGRVTGSGGDAEMETSPPKCAFDGDAQTRWVDCIGGGIGNTACWQYEHTTPVEVVEYRITSQINALASYHNALHGAPRDWSLKAQSLKDGEHLCKHLHWLIINLYQCIEHPFTVFSYQIYILYI